MIRHRFPQHGVSTRAYLFAFAIAVALPILAFAVVLLNQFAAAERRSAEGAAVDLARHVSRLVEAEHDRLSSKLEGLGASSSLRKGDLATFHEEARHAVRGLDHIVVLHDLASNQIVNTQFDFGAPLPPAVPMPEAAAIKLRAGETIVSGVFSSPRLREPRIAVTRPVELQGGIHALAITVPTTRILELIRPATPPHWTVGIGDAAGVYVAHSSRHNEFVARPTHPDYVARAVGDSGSFIGHDRFGTRLLVGYVRQPSSGWLYGANIHHHRVLAPYYRLLQVFFAFGALALAASLGAAWFFGAQYARTTAQLAGQVQALREGKPTVIDDTSIRELAEIGNALTDASVAIAEREHERERTLQRDALLRGVFDAAGLQIGILEDKPSGLLLLAANRAAAEAAGLDAEVREPRLAVSQDAPAKWRRYASEALERGERLEVEYEVAGKWFAGVVTPLLDGQGSRRVAFTALDVTARNVAQREADRRGRELALVLDTVPAGVWFTYDPDATDTLRNTYARRVMRDAFIYALGDTSEGSQPAGTVQFYAGGKPLPTSDLPLRVAMRGEFVHEQEYELRFSSGEPTLVQMSASPIRDEKGKIVGAVAVAIDATERKRAEDQRILLTNELNHRVKNTLASVQSLALNTLRTAATKEEARIVLIERLMALAKAHDILTRESWEGAALDVIVRTVVGAQVGAERFSASGPRVWLESAQTLAFSMTLHELTTNAIKYGALLNDAGRVEMSWTLEDEDLVFVWRETGGARVSPPTRKGFGSNLIERSFAGAVVMDFHPEGLVCRIRVNVSCRHTGKA